MKARLLESRPAASNVSSRSVFLKPGTIIYITGHNEMGRMTAKTSTGYYLNVGEDEAEPLEDQ